MEQIADYKIIKSLEMDGYHQRFQAAAPKRLNAGTEFVTLTTHNKNLDNTIFSHVCNHLASGNISGSNYLSKVYEVGRNEGLLYIASDYFPDGSLEHPDREISRIEVLEIIAAAGKAVHSLHENGIVHCDIQARNIKLDKPAKLSDLGILSVISPGQTLAGTSDSTPIEYQSPERIQGEAPSRASDIWALGVALHQALTGHSIFPDLPHDSLLSSVRYILNNQPVMSDALRNGERAIIEKALSIDPENRHQTAIELVNQAESEAENQVT